MTCWAYEIKFQAVYEAPPFDGHGLPPWQVRTRLALQREIGLIAVLLVFDHDGRTYAQRLDRLEEGPRFDTNGVSPRRVYPLESFEWREPWVDWTDARLSVEASPAELGTFGSELGRTYLKRRHGQICQLDWVVVG
jgi:hypothetical protein